MNPTKDYSINVCALINPGIPNIVLSRKHADALGLEKKILRKIESINYRFYYLQ
jgi:hypothetical protein